MWSEVRGRKQTAALSTTDSYDVAPPPDDRPTTEVRARPQQRHVLHSVIIVQLLLNDATWQSGAQQWPISRLDLRVARVLTVGLYSLHLQIAATAARIIRIRHRRREIAGPGGVGEGWAKGRT